MNDWHWIFFGFTAGMWGALWVFIWFLGSHDKKAAKNGFIEIDGAIYRLEKLKVGETK